MSCTFILDPPPVGDIGIEVDGAAYSELPGMPPSFNCDTDDGWWFNDVNEVTLCGNACQSFLALPTPTADVNHFCDAG